MMAMQGKRRMPDLIVLLVIIFLILGCIGYGVALTLGAYDYFSKPLSEEAMKVSLPLKVKNAIALMKSNEGIFY